MKRFFLLTLFILITCFLACESDEQVTPQVGYDYFPLTTGQFVELNMVQTNYALSQPTTSKTFVVREKTGAAFEGVNGQMTYKIEHLVKEISGNWKLDSVSTAWRTNDKALGVEHGQTIIKMNFPLTGNALWNGNLYNSNGEHLFEATEVGKPFQAGPLQFPKTVTIVRQNDSTLVRQSKHIEIYAEGVGLVRRERVYLEYCSSADCLGKGIINSGFKEVSIIKDFGK